MYGIKVADGNVINNIKKFFKVVFPQISVEIVDELAQLIFEKDPRPLEHIFSRKGKAKDTEAQYLISTYVGLLINKKRLVRENMQVFI